MNRDRLVREIAPQAPPCFSSRDQWLEYLSAAAVYQRPDHVSGPLVFEAGEPVRFDPTFAYCDDCGDDYRAAMRSQRRCRPTFVREQFSVLALQA